METVHNFGINDKKYPVDGKVIDVDVYCNDVEKLEDRKSVV